MENQKKKMKKTKKRFVNTQVFSSFMPIKTFKLKARIVMVSKLKPSKDKY